jgi:hypothetical protein
MAGKNIIIDGRRETRNTLIKIILGKNLYFGDPSIHSFDTPLKRLNIPETSELAMIIPPRTSRKTS